ncbi:MAG: gamma-glutamylcyclotransferase [Halomonadaceae bacterium]|nr:MAG: gamma-glutamylcyclotransferase [Halomonadaceae bacterium]
MALTSDTLVAVYGTLKRGCSNHHLLRKAHWLGRDRLAALALYDLGPYPAVAPAASRKFTPGVQVEIYRVTPGQLLQLDILEDHREHNPAAGLYQRQLRPSRFGPAWVYLYNGALKGQRVVPSGSW